ncbi:MAG: methionyl-tRNA formyltransferase [Betaproteobacteria bacterium RBG_16_64_18]|nr:MAG: methionyl-tRNA formyltransferase [Betaproteobacteria bacterium RBG_16_64_18]OGA14018.1 MAG: methionyl-tRNA formyltransferase [Betaproteobacteria bacterium RIFCSPLOWO2_02_FULL_65_20]OGA39320.1 MAG: methionyl-tRNA formyltransferase [Betaproteobacteria bacterium RIFCSPLOWO2_12_FULL_65_110]
MKLIFAGTPDFAVYALSALLAGRHALALVLTQPDRAAGRGLRPHPSPVKRLALEQGIPIAQPVSLKEAAVQDLLRLVGADLMVVAAYGLILPPSVLAMPRLGAINIHASLLPRWRGAAPIQRALLAGDRETGVCIMQMEAGLDTGPVLLSESIPIRDEDNAQTLHDRLADLGAGLLMKALNDLEHGTAVPRQQPAEGATYAAKIDRAEARIDWTRPALEIWRKVRAFNPHPGAASRLRDEELKIWRAAPAPHSGIAGTVLEAQARGIVVACGQGSLRIEELQRAGGRRLAPAEFLRGHRLVPGERFGN